jgi:LacI family transcriptional regulator
LRHPAPTIKTVAQRAGVHISTVSRALDPERQHLIGAAALARVQSAARELGYAGNRAASALRTGRSMVVGILLPDISNPVFPPILHGVELALSRAGYLPLVMNSASASQRRAQASRMHSHGVDGVIMASASDRDEALEYLRQVGMPVVLVNRSYFDGKNSAVISDDARAMELAVAHLCSMGHRRIAHLAGPQQFSTGVARLEGFRAALLRHGAQEGGVAIAQAYSRRAGKLACEQLLAMHKKNHLKAKQEEGFSAIIAANDLLALGIYDALAEAGLKVGQDVSVVGHNDMPLMDVVYPPLTTIRIQHAEMGLQAAQLLLGMMDKRIHTITQMVLQPELVIRQSTARPQS